MKKITIFFNEHWEKLIFGIVSLFCVYSIFISLFGLLGSNNEQVHIKEVNNEIISVLAKGKPEVIDLKPNAFVEFQKQFEAREGFDAYNKLISPARLFSQEAKEDPYRNVMDITQGHTSANSIPGANCEKFYCKIRGENVCLVCGSKGEREYKFGPPRLTDISTLRENISSALQSNPFIDRQKIRIIWEDDIETDRTIYKDRKARVFRIEINDKNEKELNEIFAKNSYQKEMRDYISKNQIMPLMKNKDSYDYVTENVGGQNYYKAPAKEGVEIKKEESKTPLTDLFKSESNDKKEEVAPANPTQVNRDLKLHKLHDEKVFFNFEDTNFEPLKRYAYILLESFTGESVTHKPLNEWKFSKPVILTTSANNYVFLTRIVQIRDESNNPVTNKDGKPLFNAEVRIYQYFPLQDMFYKKDFRELRIDDEVGAFFRKGDETKPVKTAIYKSKTEPLKGNMLTDEEWAKWKTKYPESIKARDAKIEVDQSYTIGAVIKEIGEEKVEIQVPDGKPTVKGYDEKGKPIYEQRYRTEEKIKKYILLEDLLNKTQKKLYDSTAKEVSEELEKNKVKTLEDSKDDK